jgi:hypothetical protein
VGVTGALATEALKTGEALKARQAALTSVDVDAVGAEAIEEAKREMNEIKAATDAATMSVYLKAEVRSAIGHRRTREASHPKPNPNPNPNPNTNTKPNPNPNPNTNTNAKPDPDQVRSAIGAHEKLLTKRAKQLSAGQTDRAAAAAVEVAEAAAAAGQKWVVLELDGVDAKGLQPLVQKATTQTNPNPNPNPNPSPNPNPNPSPSPNTNPSPNPI